jgi:hypothetical protein
MNRAAPIGHHNHELNESGGQPRPGGDGQNDLHGAGAIRTQAVFAGFAGGEYKPRRRIPVTGIGNASGYDKILCVSFPAPSKWVMAIPLFGLWVPSGLGLKPIDGKAIIPFQRGRIAAVVFGGGG